MCRKRLDIRDTFPSGMEEYLSMYGWHISKGMLEWATSRMKARDNTGKPVRFDPWDREKVQELLRRYGVDTKDFIAYDAEYVCNMARADYLGSSITDEQHLACFVKDYLNDTDGYDEVAMTRLYADCIGKGEPIPWDEVI